MGTKNGWNKANKTIKFKDARKLVKYLKTVKMMPLGYNRPTTDKHINDIKLSVLEIGVQRMINIVLTDIFGDGKESYVLDAQHLVKALLSFTDEQLGLIKGHFTVGIGEMDDIDLIIRKMGLLNSINKNYPLKSFLKSWANAKKEDYIFLDNLLTTNKLPLNATIEAFTGASSNGNLEFKQGKFVANRERGLRLIETYEKLLKLGFNRADSLFNALVRFTIKHPHISHREILKNIKDVTCFKHLKSRDVYIGIMEMHCKTK